MSEPFFSVIVPVLDGGVVFDRCLAALRESAFDDYELIVVDDGSSDASAEVASRFGARVFSTVGRTGPARARNLGAEKASGRFLFFIDADCEVSPETLALAAGVLEADPELDALFGSYDDSPAAGTLVSQYKNLQHHWVHQQGRENASTFWAGCGIVRRRVFEALGGFDAESYRRPSIEDIELGGRLRRGGHRIRLARNVQVKHHKQWRLVDLVRTDVFDRGVPWTELMWAQSQLGGDLNLNAAGRASGVVVCLLVAALAGSLLRPMLLGPAAGGALVLLVLNRNFYDFLRRRRGLWFTLRAVPLHWLYYLYSMVAFALGSSRHVGRRWRSWW